MASAASLLPPKNGLQAVDNVTTFSTASRNVGWFDPDDPYPYTLLTQDEIARRLLASSHLMSCILGDGIRVDSVEWQPNPTAFEVRAFDLAHGPKGGRRGGRSRTLLSNERSPDAQWNLLCSQRKTGRSCATLPGAGARRPFSVCLMVRASASAAGL
jgi:hypothetical protein